MKTNCKRLLSLVVALVMVLVMIPVFQIQADAVNLEAVEWETVNADTSPTTGTAVCPFCGGNAVTWTALTTSAKPTADAHYYVAADTTANTDFLAFGGVAGVDTCLFLTPGTTIKGKLVARAGSTVNIFGNGTFEARSATADASAVLVNSGNATVNIYGGVIIGRTTTKDTGGAIKMTGSDSVSPNILNIGGTAHIKDGNVGTAKDGGNIYCTYTNVTVSGDAQVTGGQAKRGGNIFVNFGTYTQTGGTVENGTAAGNGGNIGVFNKIVEGEATAVTISGGSISGGQVTAGSGGNIHINKTDASISGGRIGRGLASANGGAINLGDNTSSLVITGGRIFGGNRFVEGDDTAKQNAVNGGLIYSTGANVTISGGALGMSSDTNTTYHGMVAEKGGSIYMAGGTLAISGGRIYGGRSTGINSTGHGGNVYATGAEILMTGGTVDAGYAPRGGNFLLYDGSSLNVAGTSAENVATISNGASGTHGGNIYAYGVADTDANAVIVGENAMISGGQAIISAAGLGGNIHVNTPGTLTINGGTITGGQTKGNSGNICASGAEAVITMTGGTVLDGQGAWTEVEDNTETTDVVEEFEYMPINVAVFNGAVMHFQGGTIDNGDLRADSANSKVYLSGNATADPEDSRLTASLSAQFYVLAGWSGKACLDDRGTEDADYGIKIVNAQAGTLNDGTFTAGDVAYTGTLSYVDEFAPVVLDERTADVGDMAIGNIKFLNLSDGTDAMWATGLKNYDSSKYYIRLTSQGGDIDLTKDVIMDVGGKQAKNYNFITNVSEGVTLSLIDTANDGYDATKCSAVTVGTGVTVNNDVTVNGKRYITVEENGSYTAHRVSMKITGVLLDIGNEGIAFQSEFKADETIQGKLDGYGVVTSLTDMPGADFAEENATAGEKINAWTMVAAKDLPVDGKVNGHVIGNIVKNGANDTIFANLHMAVGDYTLVTDNVNTKVSMKGVMDAIDTYWNAENFLTADQKTQIAEFVEANSEYLNGFTNIGK